MGVQAWDVIYENRASSSRHRWSPSPPTTLTTMPQQQQQQQQFREPPPYPGHSKQLPDQPGFRQSFSGSEVSSDVSLSSTENLASWPRHEPQGREDEEEESQAALLAYPYPYPNPHPHPHPHSDDTSCCNILARLQGLSHGDAITASDVTSSSPRYGGSRPFLACSAAHSLSSSSTSSSSSSGIGDDSSVSGGSSLSGGGGRWVPAAVAGHSAEWSSASTAPQWHVATSTPTPASAPAPALPPPQSARYCRGGTPTYHHPHPYVNWSPHGEGQCVSERLCGRSPYPPSPVHAYLPPPPEYPGCGGGDGRVKKDGSQADLTAAAVDGRGQLVVLKDSVVVVGSAGGQPQSPGHRAGDSRLTAHSPRSSTSSGLGSVEQVVDMLTAENRRLQEELVTCYKTVSKLQKFEEEIEKVHEAYESLVKSTEKRERLEAAIMAKLQDEVKKLQTDNEQLQEQLQRQSKSKPSKKKQRGGSCDSRKRQDEADSVTALRQQLGDKEARLALLEAHLAQWEQKYLDLQASQLDRDSRSAHCDRPAGCERRSRRRPSCSPTLPPGLRQQAAHTTTHSTADLNTIYTTVDPSTTHSTTNLNTVNSSADLSHASRRVTQLENMVQWLQTQLAEKEKTLQTCHSPPAPAGTDTSSLEPTGSPRQPPSPGPHCTSCAAPSSSSSSNRTAPLGKDCKAGRQTPTADRSASAANSGTSVNSSPSQPHSGKMTNKQGEVGPQLWQV